ncbi:MAG: hypothetical protein RIQ50_1392 [Bacteroidota bacterium]|jgi:hypothetical protein
MRKLLFWIMMLVVQPSWAETTDSSGLRISLLTCSPGAELYSVFGHNALRITDSAAGTDVVYNFGTFDFNDPDFYTKFVIGKLNYFLSQETLNDFLYAYAYFGRGVTEQVLALTPEEKKQIQEFLFVNVRPENKNYKYDFFYDNCSTRLRDIIFRSRANQPFVSPVLVPSGTRFRDHLHVYLDRGKMDWTKLGIDIILGLEADHIMDVSQSMFLPDFLQLGVQKARSGEQSLVEGTYTLLPDQQPTPTSTSILWSPLTVMIAIGLYFIVLSINEKKWKRTAFISDQVLFIATGLLGLFLTIMWFATDHQSTQYNLNLIWACPLHILLAFSSIRKIEQYRYLMMMYAILLLIWFSVTLIYPHLLNPALYPIVIALSLRYWMAAKSWPSKTHT